MAPSLSTIVTVPMAFETGAPLDAVIRTVKDSTGSAVVLFTIATWNVADVWPAAIVSVEVFVWKSLPASAVPAVVVTVTVTAVESAEESVIGTEIVVVFGSASVTVTSPTDSADAAASLSAIEPDALDGDPSV